MSRHPFPLVLCALAALALPASLAAEEDEAPPFGVTDVALSDEGLPEGWALLYDEVEGTPGTSLEGWVTQVAGTAGLQEDALYFETCVLVKGEATPATVLLVETEEKAAALAAAVERAAAGRYTVRALGHPGRLLVVASPEAIRAEVVRIQVEFAVETLARLAFERLEDGSRMAALRMAAAAGQIDRVAGLPHAVVGLAEAAEGRWDEAIAAFRRAFARDAALKPSGRVAMLAYGNFGLALLQTENAESDREARDVLEKAVALEKHADPKDQAYVNRYNLACAHARLGDKDPALVQLEKSLLMAKQAMAEQMFRHFVQAQVERDPDLESLRGDPRYRALLDRLAGGGGGAPSGL